MIVRSLAFHPEEGHPAGGVAYAGVIRNLLAELYRSDDAGATWVLARWFEPGAFGLADPNWVTVAVGPDGILWAGLWDAVGGAAPNPGTVVRSLDGGQTWEHVAEGYGGWAVRAFAFGRDGRLYLAADRGLWRTMGPVVASEPSLPPASLVLTVAPNPVAGPVTLTLALPAGSSVKVAVFDVLGRHVGVVHTGPLPAGRHAFEWEAPAAGVYFVRAAGAGGVATARVAVVG
jgi:hypothetical protein